MSFFAHHKLVVIVGIVVAAVIAWWALSGSGTPAPPSLLSTQQVSGSSSADQNLVSTLLSLRAVKLEGAIFSEPAFQALQDFSTKIVPEPVGRQNPFAPLTGAASSSAADVIFQPTN